MAKSVFPSDFPPALPTVPYSSIFHGHSVALFGLGPSMATLISQQPYKPISHHSPKWMVFSAAFWESLIHRSGKLERLGRVMNSRLKRRMGVSKFPLMMSRMCHCSVHHSFREFFPVDLSLFLWCYYSSSFLIAVILGFDNHVQTNSKL